MKETEDREERAAQTDTPETLLLERLVEEVCRERRELSEMLAAVSGLTAAVLSIRSHLQNKKI